MTKKLIHIHFVLVCCKNAFPLLSQLFAQESKPYVGLGTEKFEKLLHSISYTVV